ncbi:hypothetical protein GF108_06765 [Phyllobacterium sp. SYP-B3895]|uniref:hypothetical protein n=1 Tax=Phyllobacterium sp. SYP-B3895 TaxID=2663240 RepID=UPI001299B612|nr:hypothetical protein [Phyllobacterium sp. SYP-B3895]MRG55284.1 hypothetical protein [Phyllobacterium sp. SYP-B3895]
MAELTPASKFIFVDPPGEREASINYKKDESEEAWENIGGGWIGPAKVYERVGTKDAGVRGALTAKLTPGKIYQLCITRVGEGPLTERYEPQAFATVFCLRLKSSEKALVQEYALDFGGTWSWHKIVTLVKTYIAEAGVSRGSILFDGQGIPTFNPNLTEGSLEPKPLLITNHVMEFPGLLPGQNYFFAFLVMDPSGQWEVYQGKTHPYFFTTLRRQLSVEFSTIHVYNDGDWATTGEARIQMGVIGATKPDPRYEWSNDELDDWGETDRPYALGYRYDGRPETVEREPPESLFEALRVDVWSNGKENDFVLLDDLAMSGRQSLPLPIGRGESIANQTCLLDCPGAYAGDIFHYGIDVIWSVTYVP